MNCGLGGFGVLGFEVLCPKSSAPHRVSGFRVLGFWVWRLGFGFGGLGLRVHQFVHQRGL